MFGTNILYYSDDDIYSNSNKTINADVILESGNVNRIICQKTTNTEKTIYYNNGKVVVLDLKDNILRAYELNKEEKELLRSEFNEEFREHLEDMRDAEEYAREIEEDCKEWADFGDIGCTF